MSQMVFQIRAKTKRHCASYIVDVLADCTDSLENGHLSLAFTVMGLKLSL